VDAFDGIDGEEWVTAELADQITPEQLAFTAFDALLAAYGGGGCPVDPCANDLEFVLRYGLDIDGKPFDFLRYKHLEEVYRDTARFLVLMAGAQTGKSARIFVHILRQLLIHWGALFGYYLPTLDMASRFSSNRFAPFVRSQPDFARLIGRDTARGKGQDNVLTRTIGESTMFFLTTAGRTATEGLPLHGVWFDEVRRMVRGDIERAMERYTAQYQPTDVKASTAMFPEADIHRFFLDGDQRYFHTACGCSDGIVLSLTYPDCIMDLRGAPVQQRKIEHLFRQAGLPPLGLDEEERSRYPPAVYHCPKCDTVILDPQDGWWEPHNPGAWVHSYQMPQLLSPNFPAGRVVFRYDHAEDIQEFHNSTLGLPYLDETKRPVREDHLYACVNTELKWPVHMSEAWRRRNVVHTGFGVDVQRGYLVVVVKQRGTANKHRIIHVEVLIDGGGANDMWVQLGRMMEAWSCDVCIIDNAPEWTAADRFARAFRGRVWLASYDTSGSPTVPLVTWGDAATKATDRKQKARETKFKHNVVIHRVKGLRWSLGLWVNRNVEIPDPRTLMQKLPVQKDRVVFSGNLRRGTMIPVAIARDALFVHLQQFLFRDLYDDADEEEHRKRGQTKMVAEYIGTVDPHFAHADLYAALALARIGTRRS
jgi:Phage terminase large subunit gpA, ATPase domain